MMSLSGSHVLQAPNARDVSQITPHFTLPRGTRRCHLRLLYSTSITAQANRNTTVRTAARSRPDFVLPGNDRMQHSFQRDDCLLRSTRRRKRRPSVAWFILLIV